MANPFQNVNAPTARKMVAELKSGETLMWVGVAFLVHVVIMLATSMGYIQDRWLDPQGAPARAEARKVAAAAVAAAAKGATAPQTAPTTTTALPAANPQNTAASTNTPPDDEKTLLEKNKNNPVVKSITEAAKPSEIPKAPSRAGFNLDDSLK